MGNYKRKFIFVFTTLISVLFLNTLDVKAYQQGMVDNSDIKFSINNSTSTTTNKVYTDTGNISFKLYSESLFVPAYNIPQVKYGYISVCQAFPTDITSYYSGNFSINPKVYNTNQSCNIYGSSSYPNSRIIYITYELNLGLDNETATSGQMCTGTSNILCQLDNGFTLYSSRSQEWTLVGFGFSEEPFQYDTSQDVLINQNKEILNKQDEISDKLGSTNGKLDSANSKLDEQISQNKEINKNIVETNDTLKDSDSDEATNEAGSFFSGFETDTFGLTSIVTAPLNLIESITSSTCVPMGLPIPFIEGQTLNLPCLRGIYEDNFGTFYDIYKTITFGIVAYYVCVKLFNLVKDFKNPEHDEIEVLEL